MSQDVFADVTDNYDDTELNSGIAGQDNAPKQWALLHVEDTKSGKSKTAESPELTLRLRCDETYALTPKRSVGFQRWYATPPREKDGKQTQGTKAQISGLSVACGMGPLAKDFTITKENGPQVVDMLAKSLKGKSFIGRITIEVDSPEAAKKEGRSQRADQNRIDGIHRVTEENLAAIKAANFDFDSIVVKERKENGFTKRYLTVKPGGPKKATVASGVGASASSGTIE